MKVGTVNSIPEKQCRECLQSLPENREYFRMYYGRYSSRCLFCEKQETMRYLSEKGAIITPYSIEYDTQVRIFKNEKNWWHRENRRRAAQRRQKRLKSLPNTFTPEQWDLCVGYFSYSCAVCGASFENAKSHADHWIPITSEICLGTVVENMVCLCDLCNYSKNNRLPIEWLVWKFGNEKATDIHKRIESYFDWIRKQNTS